MIMEMQTSPSMLKTKGSQQAMRSLMCGSSAVSTRAQRSLAMQSSSLDSCTNRAYKYIMIQQLNSEQFLHMIFDLLNCFSILLSSVDMWSIVELLDILNKL